MYKKTSIESLLPKYDYEIIINLLNSFDQGEGSIFNWNEQEYASGLHLTQINFHEKILQKIKPKFILETGTHKANYCYLAKTNIPDVKMWTFGINPESQICVNILNKHFNQNYIEFISGNSVQTLSSFETNVVFDLAWIDGGHTTDVALSDLKNCERLGIPNILIDDTNLPDVKNAVNKFLEFSNYQIKDQSACNRCVLLLSKQS